MANDCLYEMKIKGSKEAISRVVECLKAHYNYETGERPAHKHFFRIFDVYDDDEMEDLGNGVYSLFVFGYCAWSVSSCMLSGEYSYYNSIKESHPDIFMGTTLLEQSRDCEIEVFSEEEGFEFSEHYIFKNGVCLLEDVVEVQQAGYDKNGKLTTNIDWDTYEEDIICLNPHREGIDEPFRWEI